MYVAPKIALILFADADGATMAAVVPVSKIALIDLAIVVVVDPTVKLTPSATNSQYPCTLTVAYVKQPVYLVAS